jgi:lipid-A-disaccharide synthase
VPELIQQECTPTRLAEAMQSLLNDPAVAAAQRAGCREALDLLRPQSGSPSDAAAAAVLDMLGR